MPIGPEFNSQPQNISNSIFFIEFAIKLLLKLQFPTEIYLAFHKRRKLFRKFIGFCGITWEIMSTYFYEIFKFSS